jgi:hypothetical protein
MTEFDDREHTFEKKFALEQDLVFMGRARGTRQLGEWAAGRLGLVGEAAARYVTSLRALDVANGAGSAIVDKIVHDLADRGVKASADEVRALWDEARQRAIVDIAEGR